MTYLPKVDDYVKWETEYHTDEGWVYFVSPEYITIEVSVKDMTEENIKYSPKHKKTHVLVVCHHWNWNELKYVKNRRPTISERRE